MAIMTARTTSTVFIFHSRQNSLADNNAPARESVPNYLWFNQKLAWMAWNEAPTRAWTSADCTGSAWKLSVQATCISGAVLAGAETDTARAAAKTTLRIKVWRVVTTLRYLSAHGPASRQREPK